jgi:ribosome-associated toxin RatA of RatAB toxin-antitoxin module
MTRIERSVLLPYSAEKLFDLVNDVRAYPQYMDGCVNAVVLTQSETVMEAQLELRKGGISQRFSTRNQLEKPHKIVMELLDGPFDSLHGEWAFKILAQDACKVSLHLQFQTQQNSPRQGVAHKAAGKLFESVAGNLVDALCRRANSLYGQS